MQDVASTSTVFMDTTRHATRLEVDVYPHALKCYISSYFLSPKLS